jgi:hypothetical protein
VFAAGQPLDHPARLVRIARLAQRRSVEVDDGVGSCDECCGRRRSASLAARVSDRKLTRLEAFERELFIAAGDDGNTDT